MPGACLQNVANGLLAGHDGPARPLRPGSGAGEGGREPARLLRSRSVVTTLPGRRAAALPTRPRPTLIALLVLLLTLCGVVGRSSLRAQPRPAPGGLARALEPALEAELARALEARDHGWLSRLGAAAGARGLQPALASARYQVVMAAMRAAPDTEDGWALLEPLARHAAASDRALSLAAAEAASRIINRLVRDWEDIYRFREVPAEALAHWQHTWHAIAVQPDRGSEVRVYALAVSAGLAALGRPAADQGMHAARALTVLATDADAAVRRAAFELLPHPLSPDAVAIAVRTTASDPDATVALAAAQALCGGIALGEPPAPVLAALGPATLDRLRLLVVDSSLPSGARIDSARCLAADRTLESRRALRALQSALPGRIRGLVKRLIPARPRQRPARP